MQFLIAGFDGKETKMYDVPVKLDLEHGLLDVHALPVDSESALHTLGNTAVADIDHKTGEAYALAEQLAPREVAAFFQRHELPSLAQALTLSRVLIVIEIRLHPQYIGPPVLQVVIPPKGEGYFVQPTERKVPRALPHILRKGE